MKDDLAVALLVLVSFGFPGLAAAESCAVAGPQSPRDVLDRSGTNPRVFAVAPPASQMTLCNVHFHEGAEHKGPGFDRQGEEGPDGGYRCSAAAELDEARFDPVEPEPCEGASPGDTIEVHWVFTTCDTAPGPGLGSCLSESCTDPRLRVEAQVFLLVNGGEGLDFGPFGRVDTSGPNPQPGALPAGSGEPVVYLGSTTGPQYDATVCSPLQVTWSVRPGCELLDASTLSDWCRANVFEESHGHGVRELVTDPALLSPIGSGR